MSEAQLVARVDGGATLVTNPSNYDPIKLSQEYSLITMPDKLTIVIKGQHVKNTPCMSCEEYKITEDLRGEWELVFRPFEGFGCSALGCILWHSFLKYGDRNPKWSFDDAVTLVTKGVDVMLHWGKLETLANYAIRNPHTDEIIPKEIFCE